MNGAFPSTMDLYRVLPEMVWCGFGVILMLLQPFTKSRSFLNAVALVGTALGGALSLIASAYYGPGFNGLIQMDSFSTFFHVLVGAVAYSAYDCGPEGVFRTNNRSRAVCGTPLSVQVNFQKAPDVLRMVSDCRLTLW